MSDVRSLDEGRMQTVSAKLGERLVDVVDGEARSKIMTRASWIREAVLEKLLRDGAVTVQRADPFDLAAVMG